MKPSENTLNVFISKSDMTHGHKHRPSFPFSLAGFGGGGTTHWSKARLTALFWNLGIHLKVTEEQQQKIPTSSQLR